MLHFQRGTLDPRDFWHTAAASFGSASGTDLFIGRLDSTKLAKSGSVWTLVYFCGSITLYRTQQGSRAVTLEEFRRMALSGFRRRTSGVII
jgi:hypothetical protein